MMRIRSKQQRPLGLEALEGRLALSTGMGAMASQHASVMVTSMAQKVLASFKGQATIVNGSTLVISNIKATIGNIHLTGAGTGTVVGKEFEGGDVFLSNSAGSVHLKLGPAFVVKVGKLSKQEVAVGVLSATGQYAQFKGIMGTLTSWNIPANPKALASASGFFIL